MRRDAIRVVNFRRFAFVWDWLRMEFLVSYFDEFGWVEIYLSFYFFYFFCFGWFLCVFVFFFFRAFRRGVLSRALAVFRLYLFCLLNFFYCRRCFFWWSVLCFFLWNFLWWVYWFCFVFLCNWFRIAFVRRRLCC